MTIDGVFVGRNDELLTLRSELDAARRGQPRLVLIEGPAGIGKTALVARFLDSERDLSVLSASGEEGERELALGVLGQLWIDLATMSDQVGEPPTLSTGSDAFNAGSRLLDALGELQHENPVVVWIDDAQWADASSMQALVFTFRRLVADRVCFLLGQRSEDEHAMHDGLRRLADGATGVRVRLGGLTAPELSRVADSLGAGSLSPRAAERLREHTLGNPLHARALIHELPPDALSAPGRDLPAPRSFGVLVLRRLTACSPETEQLVSAASVLGARCPLTTAARVAELDNPLLALDEAIRANLLEEVRTGPEAAVAFVHPLIRTSIYEGLGPVRRAEFHKRAAEFADADTALRHRAAATPGQDPELAEELAKSAEWWTTYWEPTAPAARLLTAARLCPPGERRDRLFIDAVEALVQGGAVGEAATLRDELRVLPDSPRKLFVLGSLDLAAGHLATAEALLREAADRPDLALDPELVSQISAQLSRIYFLRLQGADAAMWAERAVDAASGKHTQYPARTYWVLALALSGRSQEAFALLDHQRFSSPVGVLSGLASRGTLKLWTDDLPGALHDLSTWVNAFPPQSLHPFRLYGMSALALAKYRSGDWEGAAVDAEQAASLAEHTDQAWMLGVLHGNATIVAAVRGDREIAERHAHAGLEAARRIEGGTNLVNAADGAAHRGWVTGDHLRVVEAGEQLRAMGHLDGPAEPGIYGWRELYVESLTALWRVDEAEHELAAYEEVAAARGRRSAMANAARARGTLEGARGDVRAASEAFETGLGHLADLGMPFFEALIQLAYGELLRRDGKRRDAAERLRKASETLVGLGAAPFVARAEQELAACGLAPTKRKERDVTRLTPQELAVARLVGSGATNREAATQLVLSVKTIEFHLSRVYAKLGLRSRTQLAARLAAREEDED